MTQLLAYSTIFGLTFLVVGIVTALAWAMTEQDSGDSKNSHHMLQRERLSTLSLLAAFLKRLHVTAHLQKLIDEADSDWTVGRLTLAMATGGLMTLVVLTSFDWIPWIGAVLTAAAAAVGPLFYLGSVRAKRLQAVEEQLPEALDYISRALVAGHSLPMSLELVADEVGPPLAPELRKVVDEYNLGLSMDQALENLSERLPSVDIQFFSSAIMTQSRTGGSLHDLLDGLAETIRERATLKGQVRALTANGRMTAIVLSMLPFFIAGMMMWISSEYFMSLWLHPIGKTLLFIGLGMQALAYFVISRIVDIKV